VLEERGALWVGRWASRVGVIWAMGVGWGTLAVGQNSYLLGPDDSCGDDVDGPADT